MVHPGMMKHLFSGSNRFLQEKAALGAAPSGNECVSAILQQLQ
jgi:hypothetical protein